MHGDALFRYIHEEDANFNTHKLPDQLMADLEGEEVVAPRQNRSTAKTNDRAPKPDTQMPTIE